MNWRKETTEEQRGAVKLSVERDQPPLCPSCDKPNMKYLCNKNPEAPKRPEVYCDLCHLSVPLFEGAI
jgi:hypothetical protein